VNLPTSRDSFRIQALFPNFYSDGGVAYTAQSVLDGVATAEIAVGVTAAATNLSNPRVHGVVNKYLYGRFPRFWNPEATVFRAARRRLRAGDIAYFWLEGPAEHCNDFKARGVMVVREMINCTKLRHRRELRLAYAALGEPDGTGLTDELIERERRDVLAADFVVCPNPFVKQSVMEYGLPAERCIEASYGWSPQRLGSDTRLLPDRNGFTVAFVGSIDVRKGAPVLLEAWARANIPGRLLLAGELKPMVQQKCAALLDRPDVVQCGFVRDVGSVYRSADVFCLPTWEEGGPQVTFEAMGAGVVPVVTPMGTGGAFTADEDVGVLVPPGDVEALTGALRALAGDPSRLARLKRHSLDRAADYTWERVGERRRAQLIRCREEWLRRKGSNTHPYGGNDFQSQPDLARTSLRGGSAGDSDQP
jgi:glycosyltransferase involved in cell wall biosynthesis